MLERPGLPFTLDEYRARLENVRRSMAERGIDACLVSVPENIHYLTGFTTTGYYMFQLLVVPLKGEPSLVTYLEERINILRRSWVEQYFTYSVTDDPIEVTAQAIAELGLADKVLSIEETSAFLPVAVYRRLLDSLPGVRWTSADGIVEQARLVKSPAEVAYIRLAAAAAMAGMKAALLETAEMRTENHIAAEVYRATILAGSEYPGSPPYVATGERSGLPHGTWEGRQLCEGDIVFLEHSGCVRRYSAAMMRTAFLGRPPDIVRRTADAALSGLAEAISAIRPGATSGDVDRACRDTIRRASMPDYTHETGYSIGLCYPPGWNESHIMNLHPGDETVLAPNMVFHLVPSLIIPELSGHVGFSDTVLVTERGCEVLTDAETPRELCVLDGARAEVLVG
jgi:Xaa-Pro dipeptidase